MMPRGPPVTFTDWNVRLSDMSKIHGAHGDSARAEGASAQSGTAPVAAPVLHRCEQCLRLIRGIFAKFFNLSAAAAVVTATDTPEGANHCASHATCNI
jgi:hypothetical protein